MKYHKSCSVFIHMCIAGLCLLPGRAMALTINPDIEVEAGLNSARVWRGLELERGPCAILSSSIDMDSFLAGVSVFNELGHNDESPVRGRFDAELVLVQKGGRNSFRESVRAYVNRGARGDLSRDTQEVLLGHSYTPAAMPGLRSFIDVSYDFGCFDGWYGDFGLLRSFELVGGAVDLDITLALGWCDKGYASFYSVAGDDRDFSTLAFSDFSVKAEFPVMFGERRELVPVISYTSILDSRIREAVELSGLDRGNLTWGVSFRMFF